jgi:hypothetical protein|tara:strand:+ start:9354 stop:9533 length:180 start_codon:yes stop_codon:yes gene_type:complete
MYEDIHLTLTYEQARMVWVALVNQQKVGNKPVDPVDLEKITSRLHDLLTVSEMRKQIDL